MSNQANTKEQNRGHFLLCSGFLFTHYSNTCGKLCFMKMRHVYEGKSKSIFRYPNANNPFTVVKNEIYWCWGTETFTRGCSSPNNDKEPNKKPIQNHAVFVVAFIFLSILITTSVVIIQYHFLYWNKIVYIYSIWGSRQHPNIPVYQKHPRTLQIRSFTEHKTVNTTLD